MILALHYNKNRYILKKNFKSKKNKNTNIFGQFFINNFS